MSNLDQQTHEDLLHRSHFTFCTNICSIVFQITNNFQNKDFHRTKRDLSEPLVQSPHNKAQEVCFLIYSLSPEGPSHHHSSPTTQTWILSLPWPFPFTHPQELHNYQICRVCPDPSHRCILPTFLLFVSPPLLADWAAQWFCRSVFEPWHPNYKLCPWESSLPFLCLFILTRKIRETRLVPMSWCYDN